MNEMDEPCYFRAESGLPENTQPPPPAYDIETAKVPWTVGELVFFDSLSLSLWLTCLRCRTPETAVYPPKTIFPQITLGAGNGRPVIEAFEPVCICCLLSHCSP